MLIITCPSCGPRSVEEFRYGGAAPHVPDHITDPVRRNLDYSWFLDNDCGPQIERWFHDAGCRRWSTVTRDTSTDTIVEELD
jgi:sarcosine oxidase, subunit delta